MLRFWLQVLAAVFVAHLCAAAEAAPFEFRTPHVERYVLEPAQAPAAVPGATRQWVGARRATGWNGRVEFGRRVVVQVDAPERLKSLLADSRLTLSRTVRSNVVILEAPDAMSAVREAHRLAKEPGVQASYPVLRREGSLHGDYARRSNDPFFVPYFNLAPKLDAMWPWENRDYDGTRLGIDLNVLGAWPYTMGAGITVAIADSGLELNHPELAPRMAGAPHFNFALQTTNGAPSGGDYPFSNLVLWTHGTSVAGLVAAEANNSKGMAGVAPQASLASWVIFDPNGNLAADEHLMDMYQHASDVVHVQNHSWGGGNGALGHVGPTLLEQIGIENAAVLGRGGRGVVMVRSAGNDRDLPGPLPARADDDGYANSPYVIAVGAVTRSGRVTGFSEPGACVLLAAPGGGGDTTQGLFALDLLGANRGVNAGTVYQGDLNDYRWGTQGFIGTSASAPLISGVAALVLAANTNLSARDVQHILLLAARHYDLADPDVVENGAGLRVSHNLGFGIPDAGEAVRLARTWTNLPALATFSMADNQPMAIPDDGLRVEVLGAGVPAELAQIPSRPGAGPHCDEETASLEMVYVGPATNVPPLDLANKAALIVRGENTFAEKINNAALAGAAFAVIFNYSTNVNPVQGGEVLTVMGGTDFTPIPAVFIRHSDGERIREVLQTNSAARARIFLQGVTKVFHVNAQLRCEHVGVRLRTDHGRRGDLRVTLQSPQGTRSVLKVLNSDTTDGFVDWTYWSTHHFLESSVGTWVVTVSDESTDQTGSIQSVGLIIRGTPVSDADADGLDDGWEVTHFAGLSAEPRDDPDGDGYSNIREAVMGTDPMTVNAPFEVNLSWWELAGYRRVRLSWPGTPRHEYQVFGGTNLPSLSVLTNVPGTFPEVEWLGPAFEASAESQFFRVSSGPAESP